MRRFLTASLFAASALFALPSLTLADQFCRPCPFNCEMINIGIDHCSYRPGYGNNCCVDLDNKGQDRFRDWERRGGWGQYNRPNYQAPYSGGGWNSGDRRDRYRYDRYDRYDRNDGGRRRDPGAYDDRYGYQPGACPTGYHVNERGCNPEERRRGCRDLRSPHNEICVGWF